MKHWYWRNGFGWCYRYTRRPRRLAVEAEEKRKAYEREVAAQDREFPEQFGPTMRQKVEDWQMPDA